MQWRLPRRCCPRLQSLPLPLRPPWDQATRIARGRTYHLGVQRLVAKRYESWMKGKEQKQSWQCVMIWQQPGRTLPKAGESI